MIKFVTAIIMTMLLVIGCTTPVEEPTTEEPALEEPPGMLKGVSLSPRSSSAEDFPRFFEEAVEAGQMVMWAGDWNQVKIDEGAPAVVTGLADTYGYIPLVEATFHDSGQLLRPLDEKNKQNGDTTYFQIYILVLGIYAAVRIFFALLLKFPASHTLSNISDRWRFFQFFKWIYQVYFSLNQCLLFRICYFFLNINSFCVLSKF